MFQKTFTLILCLVGLQVWAQEDSTAVENDIKSQVESGEYLEDEFGDPEEEENSYEDEDPKIDQLVFSRGFMLGATSLDTVPLSGFASGTYSLQNSIKIDLFQNIIGLRLAPGVTWARLAYSQNDLKTFPTIPDSLKLNLTQERHQFFYLELPVSVVFNITKDEDGDSEFFIEGGGYASFMMAGSYKRRYINELGLDVIEEQRGLHQLQDEWQRLRYGVFGRVGYKWAALYFNLRLSPMLDEFTNEGLRPVDSEAYRNPAFPTMEAGISFIL